MKILYISIKLSTTFPGMLHNTCNEKLAIHYGDIFQISNTWISINYSVILQQFYSYESKAQSFVQWTYLSSYIYLLS